MMALTPRIRAYTPRPWEYEDYLGATRRKSNADSQKRWLNVVALLNTEYKDEMDDAVYSIIKEIDKEAGDG
jgi:hypothetical protein